MSASTHNERAVLEYLFYRPEATVQQVAEHFDLSASTVANVTARLLEKKRIVRGPSLASGRGRPAVTFRAALPGLVAVVSFDGSHIDASLFDTEAACIASHNSDLIRVDGPNEAADLVDETVAHLLSLAHAPREQLTLVAITLNAVRRSDGSVLTSSVLPWLSDDLPDALRKRMDVAVTIVAASMMMAELQYIDDPAVNTMVRFNVGDGVSSHAIINSRVSHGRNDLAGEIGHITLDPAGPLCGCGKRGCVEAMVSGPAIREAFSKALENNTLQPTALDPRAIEGRSIRLAIEHIWQAWQQNDDLARDTMELVFDKLAWTLSIALNLIDPDLVRIDGYVLRDRQAWIDELLTRVRPQLLRGSDRAITLESARATLLDQQRIAAYVGLIDVDGEAIENTKFKTLKTREDHTL